MTFHVTQKVVFILLKVIFCRSLHEKQKFQVVFVVEVE